MFCYSIYGFLLSSIIASMAIPTIITIIVAIPMYITAFCVAIPVSGVAVGADVAAGEAA